ncbi:hypothetical protein [Chitinophaga sp. Cy-1792]|uniref:hypothetical protein n=1 Tax=Chitinophaga sp. Cy-1792 TaxID=2608339 RepID=UPI0014227387|nr:hypothetical protein [Chitinophaga sp. Cy-1792]NIG54654.1 hypothetical protein [Chitinophaga sp. Cy-1792]
MKSFYNPEYVIEITEKRFAAYSVAYNLVMNKYAILMLFYSGISVSLTPMVRQVIQSSLPGIVWLLSFIVFISLFVGSVIMAIFFLQPVGDVFLPDPEAYHIELRKSKERDTPPNEIPLIQEIDRKLINEYLEDMEKSMKDLERIFNKKKSLYANSFFLVVFSMPAFIICLFLYLLNK